MNSEINAFINKYVKEIRNKISGYKSRDYLSKVILKPLVKVGKIKLTIPDKPQSSKQQYVWHNIDIK